MYDLQVLQDDEVSKYVSGIAVHWYENFWLYPPSLLTITHNNHPDKFLLATEASDQFALACYHTYYATV